MRPTPGIAGWLPSAQAREPFLDVRDYEAFTPAIRARAGTTLCTGAPRCAATFYPRTRGTVMLEMAAHVTLDLQSARARESLSDREPLVDDGVSIRASAELTWCRASLSRYRFSIRASAGTTTPLTGWTGPSTLHPRKRGNNLNPITPARFISLRSAQAREQPMLGSTRRAICPSIRASAGTTLCDISLSCLPKEPTSSFCE